MDALQHYVDTDEIALGAFASGRLVGIGVVVPHLRPRIAQLEFLHVCAPLRATGIGSRLSEQHEHIARTDGDSDMVVLVTPSENTLRFYLGRGYQPMAEPLANCSNSSPRKCTCAWHFDAPVRAVGDTQPHCSYLGFAVPALPEPAWPIADGVVRLWRFTMDDVPEVTRACRDPQISRWILSIPSPYEEHHAQWWIAQHDSQWAEGTQGGGVCLLRRRRTKAASDLVS